MHTQINEILREKSRQLNELLREKSRYDINQFLFNLAFEVNKFTEEKEQINLTQGFGDALSEEIVEKFGDKLLSYLQKQAEEATERFDKSVIEIRLVPAEIETETMRHNEMLTAEEADTGILSYSDGVKRTLAAVAEVIGDRYDSASLARYPDSVFEKKFTGDWEQTRFAAEIRMTKNQEVM